MTEAGDGSVAVLRALDALPAGERQAVVLADLLELSVLQIAARTARACADVQADLDRGRARLARLLRAQECGERQVEPAWRAEAV